MCKTNIGRSFFLGGEQTPNIIAADLSLQPTWPQAMVPCNTGITNLEHKSYLFFFSFLAYPPLGINIVQGAVVSTVRIL